MLYFTASAFVYNKLKRIEIYRKLPRNTEIVKNILRSNQLFLFVFTILLISLRKTLNIKIIFFLILYRNIKKLSNEYIKF